MQHRFLLRHLRHDHHHFRHYHPSTTTTTTSSSVVSSINWVRDRALDHAVEKERDLKPMINLKNLINSEPSKSLPLNIISNQRSSLGIPTRPIDFIRKYPSIIQEFLPGGIGIHPHVKLTPETLTLDAEEQLLFDSDIHKKDVANRLLKLLMLGRVNRIPLSVIDRLKWDLGLPNDYVETLVPEFPDYFRVVRNSNWDDLELVCWSDELAVSVMEANSVSEFPLKYSRGFEVDNKFKKWVDEWQKLPYVSPYENMSSLKSEEAEKWVVGLMHEVLHILVPKKTEKDNLLVFGEYLGVRSRFKKALLEHPGIFYVSSKLHTHTVVLREGYKRDLLVERVQHPVMKLRSSYIHLMNMVKEKSKSKDADVGEKKQKRTRDLDVDDDDDDDDELSDDVSEEEEDDDETEGVIDGDDDGDSESEDLEDKQRIPTKRTNLEGRKIPDQRSRSRRSDDNSESEDLEAKQRIPTKRTPFEERKNPVHRSRTRRSNENRESEDLENGNTTIRGRTSRTEKFNDSNRRNTSNSRVNDNDGRRGRGNDRKYTLDERYSRTNRVPDRRDAKETNPRRFLRTESPGARASRDRSSERSNGSRTREGRSSEIPGVSRTREGRSSERPGASRTREGRSSERPGVSRTREGRSSERPGASRTREGRSSERPGVSRTREGRF